MKVQQTDLPGVLVVEPDVFVDDRGLFFEYYNFRNAKSLGIVNSFVQDNFSRSKKNVLRGLHFQHPNAQGKLVSVTSGSVLDVAVDVRVGSPTFARYVAVQLDSISRRQLWIPRGFAHGFLVLSESADFFYKCDASYSKADEISVRWNDPAIGIQWPVSEPILSAKDAEGALLDELAGRLPHFN